MDTGLVTTLIVIGVVVVVLVVLGLWLWSTARTLGTLHSRVDASWSSIRAEVERRAALIPTVVDAVARYATHEKGLLDAVRRARAETLEADDAAAASEAEGHMQKALRSMFATAEGYPQLQSSAEFLRLQSELVATEDAIQSSRRHYNGGVRELNAKIRAFPASSFARNRGIAPAAYFETTEPAAIAEPPRVQF